MPCTPRWLRQAQPLHHAHPRTISLKDCHPESRRRRDEGPHRVRTIEVECTIEKMCGVRCGTGRSSDQGFSKYTIQSAHVRLASTSSATGIGCRAHQGGFDRLSHYTTHTRAPSPLKIVILNPDAGGMKDPIESARSKWSARSKRCVAYVVARVDLLIKDSQNIQFSQHMFDWLRQAQPPGLDAVHTKVASTGSATTPRTPAHHLP